MYEGLGVPQPPWPRTGRLSRRPVGPVHQGWLRADLALAFDLAARPRVRRTVSSAVVASHLDSDMPIGLGASPGTTDDVTNVLIDALNC